MSALSGGQKARLELTKLALKHDNFLVLDEPTNHLDIQHQVFIMDYLRKKGKTILIVLHDLNLASVYCDRLFLLKNGQNVVNGTPQEVLTRECVQSVFHVDGAYMPSGYDQAGFFLRLGKI